MNLPFSITEYYDRPQKGVKSDGVSIIIPIRGIERLQNLDNCLFYIKNNFLLEYEILVVEEDSVERINNLKISSLRKIFIKSDDLFNKSKCFNVGVKESKYSTVCGLDCDMILTSSFFKEVLEKFKNHDVAFPGKEIYFIDSADKKKNFVWSGDTWTKRTSERFHGGVFLIKKEAYWRIGGFYEKYMGHGSEDTDFFSRCHIALNVCPFVKEILLHQNHPESDGKNHDKNEKLMHEMLSLPVKERIAIVVKDNEKYFDDFFILPQTTLENKMKEAQFEFAKIKEFVIKEKNNISNVTVEDSEKRRRWVLGFRNN